jgi:V/A-type H+-transporting ATPase subunit I
MGDIRKIKVLILEECIDQVLRTLCRSGCVQLINLTERRDSFQGALEPYGEPRELLQQGVNLQSRIQNNVSMINDIFDVDDAKGNSFEQVVPVLNRRSAEVIEEIQRRIAEIEERLTETRERLTETRERLTETRERLTETRERLTETRVTLAKIPAQNQELQQRRKGQPLLKELITQVEIAEKTILDEQVDAFTGLEGQLRVLETQLIQHKPELVKTREELLSMRSVVETELLIGEVKSNMLRTAKTVYFEAYVRPTELQGVITSIRNASNELCQISDERPSHGEAAPSTGRLAPGFLIAFEKLTLASGYPASSEVNPIPIIAITFPLLFGIMFADVGQGILLALLGVILSIVRRRVHVEEVGDILRYVLVSGEMFVFMGIASICFGFLFGEFFGASGILHPISLGRIGPFYIGGFEPTQEPMKMLKFAILVGVAHLSLGLVLRIVNETKKRHYKFVPVPICWLWLLFGGLTMWAYWGGISNISSWFADGLLMLLGLIILPLVLIMVVTGLAENFTEGIGFGVEVFAETLSHTLSYGRLMALGLVHSVLNNLFLVLGGVEHGVFPLSSVPIIAIGTILVMTVEGLIVFVHTLRLHWIEWFSKFFSGGGIPFKPYPIHRHT